MKKISNHLGEIIIALACVSLLITTVTVFGAPISDFFSSIVDKETALGNQVMESIGDIDISNIGIAGSGSGESGGGAGGESGNESTSYLAVKNGGSLRTIQDTYKSVSRTVELYFAISNGAPSGKWFYGATLNSIGLYWGGQHLTANLNVGNYEKKDIVKNYHEGEYVHVVIVVDSENLTKKAYCNGVMVGSQTGTTNTTFTTFQDGIIEEFIPYVSISKKNIWERALTDEEVSKLYNNGKPQNYILKANDKVGLVSSLTPENISADGWYDTVKEITIPFNDDVKLIEDLNNSSVIYPDFEVVSTTRSCHDCTFIEDKLYSFNISDLKILNGNTLKREKTINIDFVESLTNKALEMKSCDYKFGKLLVGNGRAIKYEETSYLEQGSKLYVFYDAEDWYDATSTITFDNCGDYDVIDISSLGYKVYGFWSDQDDMIYVSCNLFNDIYLIQLDKTDGRYNGNFNVIDHWSLDGDLGQLSGHGGQFYDGYLYIAPNDINSCSVFKFILSDDNTFTFKELRYEEYEDDTLKYRYIDGMAIKDDKLYAQPLTVKDFSGTNYTKIIVGNIR